MQVPRNCEEATSFEECKRQIAAALHLSEQEFDEAYLFPLQQLIIYNPALYPCVEGSELRVFATDATPRYPSIYIAYTFDDECIRLHYAEVKQADE